MAGNRQAFDVAIRRGHAFARQQGWDKAIVEYRRALAEFPDDLSALAGAASACVKLKRLPEALSMLQRANQLKPDDLNTLGRLADVQAQMSKLSEAARTYAALGDLHSQQGNTDQAMDAWTRASQLDPHNVENHQKLASAYQAQDKIKLAVQEMLAVVKIYQKKGLIEQAAQQCRAALALDPRNTGALKMMEAIRVGRATGPLPPLPETSAAAPVLGTLAAGPELTLSEMEALTTQEPEKRPAGPVDKSVQKALSDLAESIFEDTLTIPSRPDARGAAAHLTKKEIDALIGQALDFQTGGQTQEAIAAYRRILEAVELPAAHFNLGLLYEQELAFDQAIEQFQQCVAHTEYTLGSQYALGECLRAQGQVDQALRHFVEALKIVDMGAVGPEQAGDLAAIYDSLSTSLAAQTGSSMATQFTDSVAEFLSGKDWEDKVREARQRLDSLVDEGAPAISLGEVLTVPHAESILQALALTQEYTQHGQFYTAMEEAYTAILCAPDYLPMHRHMADMLWESGRQEEAIAKYLIVADAYQTRGEKRHTMTIYRRLVRLMPMDVQIRSRLIDLLISHGEIDQALEQYMAQADAHYQLAQIDKARETYEAAMHHVPRTVQSRHWARQILHKIGDIDVQRIDWRRAIQDYEQIKSIAPDDEGARLSLIELWFKTGESARAMRELDELLVTFTSSGKGRHVIPVLEEQTRNHPNEMGLRMRLGRAYLSSGMPTQAIEQLDALGELQLEAGLQKEAAATIRGIIALNPPNVAQYQQVLAQISTARPM
jgi:tetratricopeptide (TPR) repeat protein